MTDTDFDHNRATDGLPQQEDATYNGWTNYPTWAVNLWLSNDRGLYEATLELVQAGEPPLDPTNEDQRFQTADALRDWVTNDLAPDLGGTFASDLLGYALSQVDWLEIADSWLEDTAETVPA